MASKLKKTSIVLLPRVQIRETMPESFSETIQSLHSSLIDSRFY